MWDALGHRRGHCICDVSKSVEPARLLSAHNTDVIVLSMSSYRYQPLSSTNNSIRLLRLMPNRDPNTEIQCELFEYSLQDSCESHLYEALSYVWGDANKKLPVIIHGHRFDATVNLHAALSRLRNHSIERILWIDAICIDQQNTAEKEYQIQFMATIYARAYRVVVWLGEASDDSDLVFGEMLREEGKTSPFGAKATKIDSAAVALLKRPWFQRIWILQEVAAARNIVVMCGRDRIDGYAFCLGTDGFIDSYEIPLQLQSLIRSVSYLIRGAIFRPEYSLTQSSRSTLNISPLSELVDMYHANHATHCHDKVYALLGMSTDNLSNGDLLPNYRIPWAELLQRLVRHVISDEVSVETWGENQAAVIKSGGWIVGEIISVKIDPVRGDRYRVEVLLFGIPLQSGLLANVKYHWTLQTTSNSIHTGDLICRLRGASKPTIVRLGRDYFKIIMVAVKLIEEELKYEQSASPSIGWTTPVLPQRTFLLLWDWEQSLRKTLHSEYYETWIRMTDWESEKAKLEIESHLARAKRLWNVTLTLCDMTTSTSAYLRDSRMEERGREAIGEFDVAIAHKDITASELRVVKSLLLEHIDLESYSHNANSGLQPLLWAADGKHDVVVELLLDSMHKFPPTLLSQAAKKGHETVVRLLLQKDMTEHESSKTESYMALLLAAEAGNAAVVKLLLDAGRSNVDFDASSTGAALLKAATLGHEHVVKLLLETTDIKVDVKDEHGHTPLLLAASRGKQAVVKLLLATGKVDLNSKGIYGDTSLFQAIDGGHDEVVKLLVRTGNIDLGAKNRFGETPLERAISKARQAEPLSASELGSVEDQWGMLNWPSERERRGLQAIITLLQDTEKIEVETKNKQLHEPGNAEEIVEDIAEETFSVKRLLSRKMARGRQRMAKLR
ncbi:hypothetical protein HBH56_113530 [Parastagonospora nodorum]|uniref:Heterokaryon incompatibility domain-containing protein n=1 Tax=Phaeosphaeria nodorum (strain SN15 / ATCC MYA-4574 / FGSC 10173) TaxID=321614 RepID=A0A7U2FIM6_PHANO|nr:hypothetical protein HBH56_113530 [Parastagonospora nodorum]QRD03596.1 hypothetical protein JI435_103470 [Parastagonospora nodorum SN15]KAH3921548.1 hypothetical protein HBH54_238890 [Parastagonospora nodorum]KAH4138577.1 hypothetical protein HBH45_108860 [Parastagonospora nodorum]KAH4163558.1 hypothetical protein HBH44_084230 [Parastagonospora nodorum]